MSHLSTLSSICRINVCCIRRSVRKSHLKIECGSLCSLRFYASFEALQEENASVSSHTGTRLVLSACASESSVLQRSEEWFALRKDKLTSSSFSTVLGFWKGNRRYELWKEKVFESQTERIQSSAMSWGNDKELEAINCYKRITGNDVGLLGFAIHTEERLDWLGASPDGLLGCLPDGGILEVKCPFNNGKLRSPWKAIPFYYMPQVQGQMEIMCRDWVDLYCWTPKGSTIFRVNRDRDYWQFIHGILHEFWWANVIPAREALLMGLEAVDKYKPESTHKLTGLAIARSIQLAAESKMRCREIAGNVEFLES